MTHLVYLSAALILGWALGQTGPQVPVALAVEPLATPKACVDSFRTRTLNHVTSVPGGDRVRSFEANGGGVALGDLDTDGDLDVVLANHAGANTLLWNEGELKFRTERLGGGDARAIAMVDVDADGHLDLVFTRRASGPNLWRNLGGGTFAPEILPGVSAPLYTATWADLDADGDLDLVGGTYDAALLNALGPEILGSGNSGVYIYENRRGGFRATRLAGSAQALALTVTDLDEDGHPDIVVGNDFAVPDMIWYRRGRGWAPAAPFSSTSHSTMSFDLGDIDNDGRPELFSTDMKPYADDEATRAAWQPLLESFEDNPHAEDDPQTMANALQIASKGGFINEAEARGVEATGWSWSGKFGDLDNDGYLDLYVVNGMAEATIFSHLPDHELVEANQAFRNDGSGRFLPAPFWGLGSTQGGRGMAMGDLDGDGDLDIVVNNLRGPAELFENRLCTGRSLLVDLHWPGSANTRAIGAVVILHSNIGTLRRDVRVTSGYLSSDPTELHFGFPKNTSLHALEVRWPDDTLSRIEGPRADTRISVRREGR